MGPIEFMTRIEKTFVKMVKLQAPKNRYLVKNNVDGQPTKLMINRQLGLILSLSLQGPISRKYPCTMKHGNSSDPLTVSLTRCKSWSDILQQQW